MVEKKKKVEEAPMEQWGRVEAWAERLCVPTIYLREKLQGVTVRKSSRDTSGKLHMHACYGAVDVERCVPDEYGAVMELEKIGKTREEIRKEMLRKVLAKVGYPDRRSLEATSAHAFKPQDFPPHGKGHAFYVEVTGKTLKKLLKSHLQEIADALELPALSEERKAMFRRIFASAGYMDLRSIERKNPSTFQSKEFPPYGKGIAFYRAVTGKTLKKLLKSHLQEIADALELPALSDERKEEMRQLLGERGYPDRRNLERVRADIFQTTDFPPYGKGVAFYRAVTGNTVRRLRKEHLQEIADMLELPALSEERKEEMRQLLRERGYPDRRSVEGKNVKTFQSEDFSPYGKGVAFYAEVTGEIVGFLRKDHLQEIADALDLP